MMLGIGLGVMALLCAVGLIAGGGLLMHYEGSDSQDQPATEWSHDNGKAPDSSQGSLNEEKKCGKILLVSKEEVRGEQDKYEGEEK
jgi:hypothetical protein